MSQCTAHDSCGYCCQLVDGHDGGHEYWTPPPKIHPITVSGAGGYLQLRGGTTSIDLDLTFAVFRALRPDLLQQAKELAESIASFMCPR